MIILLAKHQQLVRHSVESIAFIYMEFMFDLYQLTRSYTRLIETIRLLLRYIACLVSVYRVVSCDRPTHQVTHDDLPVLVMSH